MRNEELVRGFAAGATKGFANSLGIRRDILYSYAMPIAKRLPNGTFEISNRMRALGGEPRSRTTSAHIGLAYRHCRPSELVDQVVEKSNTPGEGIGGIRSPASSPPGEKGKNDGTYTDTLEN